MPTSDSDPDLPRISAAEWHVAEAIWLAGRPVSSTEIVERLSATAARHPKTVRTLLHRLLQKRVVVTERRGRTDYFFPRLSRKEFVDIETRAILDRLFEGRRVRLLMHFLQDGADLNAADLATLRERIAELQAQRPG